jgi:hypothetical protein
MKAEDKLKQMALLGAVADATSKGQTEQIQKRPV